MIHGPLTKLLWYPVHSILPAVAAKSSGRGAFVPHISADRVFGKDTGQMKSGGIPGLGFRYTQGRRLSHAEHHVEVDGFLHGKITDNGL
jgi:hypothetical protein